MATIKEILDRKGTEVISVSPGDTVQGVARLMNERGIGGVVVMDGDRLAGIFTERDVLRRVVGAGLDPAATAVQSVMTTGVVVCRVQATVEECMALMTSRRIRHLPISDDGRLAGVVTIGDLLAWQVADQAGTIEMLNSYIYENR